MSKREESLEALAVILKNIPDAIFSRNNLHPEKAPPHGGLVSLYDGEISTLQEILSPRLYIIEHRAELHVIVQRGATSVRDKDFDALLSAVGVAIQGAPTLGGVVDSCFLSSPQITEEAIEGAASVKTAIVPVVLEYVAETPLG